MSKKTLMVLALLAFAALTVGSAWASPLFVATAQNFRGAVFLGYGPTPYHASEVALSACSQNSFVARSCKVVGVRMECPPPPLGPPPKAYKSAPPFRSSGDTYGYKKSASSGEPGRISYSASAGSSRSRSESVNTPAKSSEKSARKYESTVTGQELNLKKEESSRNIRTGSPAEVLSTERPNSDKAYRWGRSSQ